MPDTDAAAVLRTVRRLLLGLFATAVTGAGVELLLLGHTEDTWQWIPLILLGGCLLVTAWHAVRPSRASVRTLRGLGFLCVAGGLLGLFLHYRGNAEFELEMYPTRAGWELFRESMTGATPALAPGTMIILGSLALLYTFRHPRLAPRPRSTPHQAGDTL